MTGPSLHALAMAAWVAMSGSAAAAGTGSLADVFEPYVKTLTRDVYTYHYVTRERLGLPREGPVAVDDERLAPYVRAKVGRYWDLTLQTHPDAMVSGLYVGTDPVATRAYGGAGEIWALVQVVLARGFRFVDVRHEGWRVRHAAPRRLPEALTRQLSSAGCTAESLAWLLTGLDSALCREIAVATMRAFDVDGILYSFPNVPYNGCPARPDGAFIVVRPEKIRVERLAVFTRWIADERTAASDRRAIAGLFARARDAGSRRGPLWPDSDAAVTADVDDTWMREHLFGCGAHAEDAVPPSDAADIHYNAARALAEQGDIAAAVAAYRKALSANREHAPSANDLAWILATSADAELRDPPGAVRLAGLAVELSHYKQRLSTAGANWPKPFKIRVSHTMAAAYAASGDFAAATEYMRQALAAAEKLHDVSPSPETVRLLDDSRMFLELYESGRPYRLPPGRPPLPQD